MRSRRRSFVVVVVCGALLAAVLTAVGSPTPAGAAVPPGFEVAWGSLGAGNGQFTRPVAIASGSGFIYVVDNGNNRVELFDDDGVFVGQFGSFGSGNTQFNNPNGVAVGLDGSVFVADTGNHRIVKFDGVGNYQAQWGIYGTGNGQFNFPGGVAVDPVSGNVFVADTLNHRVQKFTPTGTYKTKWGAQGTANGRFDTPGSIEVSADRRVYVADGGNDRVQQFTGTGVFQRQWGGAGTADGRFDNPSGIAVDSAGSVYVADTQNHRVQQFTPTGTFLSKWGTNGSQAGQFYQPVGIGIAAGGVKVLVADTFNHRIQRFAPGAPYPGGALQFASAWGQYGAGDSQFDFPDGIGVDSAGNVYVADSLNNRIQKFSASGTYLTQWGTAGSGAGQFLGPSAVAIDASDNVYVTDYSNNRVEKFTSAGVFITAWGTSGSGNGQFDGPAGVAVDSSGNVYVADMAHDRIQKFTSTGTFLTQWGSSGTGDGQFQAPMSVGVDASGNVYVADTGNGRVQRFTAAGGYLSQSFVSGSPVALAVDHAGDVYVVQSALHRVRKFTGVSLSLVSTFGSSGGGDGQFNQPLGVAVSASGMVYVTDSGNYRVQRFVPAPAAAPSAVLSADQVSVNPGDPIDYHLTITNNAGSTLTGLIVADRRAPDCEGPLANLAPAASITVSCTYNTGADDAGPYENTATVDSDQTDAVNSNTVTTQVGAAVTVAMTAPSRVMATSDIAYSIAITNNTALPLTSVRVTDPAVPSCAGPVADISAGATANVNCTKATTDADSGSVVANGATVDAAGTQAGSSNIAVTRVQGRVTGTITGPGGPVAGAYVLALSRDFLPLAGDAVANGSGVYNLGLDPGRYYLAFLDPSGATQAEYYNNKSNVFQFTSADLVTVNVGSGPATANAVLAASSFSPPVNPASVSGTVTDANGPVAGVWVVGVHFGLGGVVGATRTDAAGHYTLGGLPAGNNYLEFADPSGTHAFRWYHNDDGSNPTAIPLTAGQVVTNINEVLPPYP